MKKYIVVVTFPSEEEEVFRFSTEDEAWSFVTETELRHPEYDFAVCKVI